MTLTCGSLFSGTGMLDEGVQSVLGGELSWYAEFDAAASKVMAHHYPGIPNLGDVTKVDWASVPHIDILTGGSPCQDLSHAGKRAGMTAGTRSNLWVQMREAIAVLRPRLVVWENVRGALSASADSDLEPCPGCMGDPDDGAVLRALGRVLGDLADLGYDARWYGLRAADVGAPHGRFRIFLFAVPADATGDPWWLSDGDRRAPADADLSGRGILGGLDARGRDADGRRGADADGDAAQSPTRLTLLPTPDAYEGLRGGSQHPDKRRNAGHSPYLACVVEHLLPTPTASEANGAGKHGEGGCDPRTTVALLPTPRATDGTNGGPGQRGSAGDLMLSSAVALLPTPVVNDMGEGKTAVQLLPTPSADFRDRSEATGNSKLDVTRDFMDLGSVAATNRWGDYGAAIARWAAVVGRPAPAPTEPGPKGGPRLSAAFVEWLMGLPAGHVTDCGLTRNEALRVLGNGVVPQQAAAATARFVDDFAASSEAVA